MFNKMGGFNRQKGFTLVEVLTVMLVMAAMASVTVETASTLAFQGRYEVTKDRYEKIKAAILGNPNIVVNGHPDISGFVADVGRLPFALQELLDGNFCSDTRYFTDGDCTTNGGVWTATPYWNGPYISSTQPAIDTRALSDGWGNTGIGNYGWNVTFLDNSGNPTTNIGTAVSMNIQSKAKDGCIYNGVTCPGTETYDADYPNVAVLPSIRSQDWKVNVDNISAMIMASSIAGACAPFPSPSDPATCGLTGGTWTPPCIGAIPPNSKLGCESASGTWNYDTSNLCIKITQNGKVYKSEGTLPTISENGREQLISFASVFHDANGNTIKDSGENMIPLGAASIGIYTDCTFTTKYNDTSPTKNEVQVTFSPNIMPPTINW